MKHRHTRIAATAVAALGLAMGATIAGASSAHAVGAVWNCNELTPSPTVPGEVDGSFCQIAADGEGFLEQDGTTEYLCFTFHRELEYSASQGYWWDVVADGCTSPE